MGKVRLDTANILILFLGMVGMIGIVISLIWIRDFKVFTPSIALLAIEIGMFVGRNLLCS